jgi:hypothetical protein
MHKIPLLFKREGKYAIPEINPPAAWVLEEVTIAHRKYDGTAMMFDGYNWWVRRQVGPDKTSPPGFVEVEHDPNTNKIFGWDPVSISGFFEFWKEALAQRPLDCDILDLRNSVYEPGTYELLGPKINGNPEKLKNHRLMPHNRAQQLGDIQFLELDLVQSVEQAYDDLRKVLAYLPIEGIVFKDQKQEKMAKLRRKDFNFEKEELNARVQESRERERGFLSDVFKREGNDWQTPGVQR